MDKRNHDLFEIRIEMLKKKEKDGLIADSSQCGINKPMILNAIFFFKYRKKGFLLCLVIMQNPISQVIKLDVKEGANNSLLIWETMRDVVGRGRGGNLTVTSRHH